MSDIGLTDAEFRALYQRVRQASARGPADRRGALNHITPGRVVAAAGGVAAGRAVSLAAPVESEVTADNPEPAVHEMASSATGRESALSFAMDRVAMNIHGNADSHLDALCHVVFDGTLYNGIGAGSVTAHGATELSVEAAGGGIVGRGVLLDIPRARRAPPRGRGAPGRLRGTAPLDIPRRHRAAAAARGHRLTGQPDRHLLSHRPPNHLPGVRRSAPP
jgi:hypothetical protein